MRLLIIGGSGRIGQLVIDEALARGHTVTALVRNETSLSPRPGLALTVGSPLSVTDIEVAFTTTTNAPVEAVIVTLRLNTTSDSPFAALLPDTPPHLGADSVTNLLSSMKVHNVRKIVVLSAQGVGSSIGPVSTLHKMLFRWSNMRHQVADHDAVDRIVRAAVEKGEEVDFVLPRPVMMVEGEAGEVRDWRDDGSGAGFMPKITRRSVARFIVEAVEGKVFDRRSPVISN